MLWKDRKSATLSTEDSLWIGSLGRSAVLTAHTSLSGSKFPGSKAHSGGFGSLHRVRDLWWGITLGWQGAMKDPDGLLPSVSPKLGQNDFPMWSGYCGIAGGELWSQVLSELGGELLPG